MALPHIWPLGTQCQYLPLHSHVPLLQSFMCYLVFLRISTHLFLLPFGISASYQLNFRFHGSPFLSMVPLGDRSRNSLCLFFSFFSFASRCCNLYKATPDGSFSSVDGTHSLLATGCSANSFLCRRLDPFKDPRIPSALARRCAL